MSDKKVSIDISVRENLTSILNKVDGILSSVNKSMETFSSMLGKFDKSFKGVSRTASEGMGVIGKGADKAKVKVALALKEVVLYGNKVKDISNIRFTTPKEKVTTPITKENLAGLTSRQLENIERYKTVLSENLGLVREQGSKMQKLNGLIVEQALGTKKALDTNKSNKHLIDSYIGKYKEIVALKLKLASIPFSKVSGRAILESRLLTANTELSSLGSNLSREPIRRVSKEFRGVTSLTALTNLKTQYEEIARLTKKIKMNNLAGLGSSDMEHSLSLASSKIREAYRKASIISKETALTMKKDFNNTLKQIDTDILVRKQKISDAKALSNLRSNLAAQERLLVRYEKMESLRPLGYSDSRKAGKVFREYKKSMHSAVASGIRDTTEAGASLERFNSKFGSLTTLIGSSTGKLSEWWHRFGTVALGFTIMYRAMNAIEFAIRGFITEIGKGIQAFDDLQVTTMKNAVFNAIFNKSVKNWSSSVRTSRTDMMALQTASVEAFSAIDDLNQAMAEFAMHGYFVPPSMMKQLANFVDFVNMVATTTGSTTRQVKQEIASLFSGIVRVSDATLRFIRSTMSPDKFNKLLNNLSESKDIGKNIKSLLDAISIAMQKAKNALKTTDFIYSLKILQNNFELVVIQAIRLASVMKGMKGKNLFAMAINSASIKLGIASFRKLLLIQQKYIEATKKSNKIKINIAYGKQFDKFIVTPLGRLYVVMSKIFVQLSDLIPGLISLTIAFLEGFSKVVFTVERVYRNLRILISVIITMVKYVLIAKTAMLSFKIVTGLMMFPIKMLISGFIKFTEVLNTFRDSEMVVVGSTALLEAPMIALAVGLSVLVLFLNSNKNKVVDAIKNLFNFKTIEYLLDHFRLMLDGQYIAMIQSFKSFVKSLASLHVPLASIVSPLVSSISNKTIAYYKAGINDLNNTLNKLHKVHKVPQNLMLTANLEEVRNYTYHNLAGDAKDKFKKVGKDIATSFSDTWGSIVKSLFGEIDKNDAKLSKKTSSFLKNLRLQFKHGSELGKPMNKLALSVRAYTDSMKAASKSTNAFTSEGLTHWGTLVKKYNIIMGKIHKFIKTEPFNKEDTKIIKKDDIKEAKGYLVTVTGSFKSIINSMVSSSISFISKRLTLAKSELKLLVSKGLMTSKGSLNAQLALEREYYNKLEVIKNTKGVGNPIQLHQAIVNTNIKIYNTLKAIGNQTQKNTETSEGYLKKRISYYSKLGDEAKLISLRLKLAASYSRDIAIDRSKLPSERNLVNKSGLHKTLSDILKLKGALNELNTSTIAFNSSLYSSNESLLASQIAYNKLIRNSKGVLIDRNKLIKVYSNELKSLNDREKALSASNPTDKLTINKLGESILSVKTKLYNLTHTKDFSTMARIGKGAALALKNSFSSLFFDAMQGKLKSLKSYFLSFTSSIERMISQMLAKAMLVKAITALIPGGGSFLSSVGFAKGGAFVNGVQAFASGGIINQPTLFPMRHGLGLAGEAGAEAVVPLTRTSNGDLGIKSQGSSVHLNIVNTVDPELVGQYLATPNGENTILNVIQKHSYKIKRSLQLV